MTTKTAQFTPGPWTSDGATILYVAPSNEDQFDVIEVNAPYHKDDRLLIAYVPAGFEQSQQNATLIAAAPAMYEALSHVWEVLGKQMSEHDSAMVEAALAQAEGRQA